MAADDIRTRFIIYTHARIYNTHARRRRRFYVHTKAYIWCARIIIFVIVVYIYDQRKGRVAIVFRYCYNVLYIIILYYI